MKHLNEFLNEGKKSDIKKGDKVKVKKEWLDAPEEADIVYDVKSNPNSNNRVDIVDPNSKLSIPGIESVKVEYLEKV
jgi:hypothetical protein